MNSDPLLMSANYQQNSEYEEYKDVSKCIYEALSQLDRSGIEKNEKFKSCALCDFRCRPDKINAHYFVHLLDNFDDFECPDCARLFVNLDGFIEHINQHDLERNQPHSCMQIGTNEKTENLEDLDFDIDLLDLDAKQTDVDLESVSRIERELAALESPNIMADEISSSNSEKSNVPDNREIDLLFNCNQCDFEFSDEESLANHKKVHQQFTCKYCNSVFILESSLKDHLKKHEGIDVNYCEVCEVPYVEKSDLQNHFNKCHSNLMDFKCTKEKCKKSFKSSSELRLHLTIHKNQRIFDCKNCEKKFSYLTSLRNHKLVHEKSKNFQCHYCARFFSFNGNLKVCINFRIFYAKIWISCITSQKYCFEGSHKIIDGSLKGY
jgi:hypothetical protein